MPFTKSDISSRQYTNKKCATKIMSFFCLISVIVLFFVAPLLHIGFDSGVGLTVNTAGITVHTSKVNAHTTVHAITTNIPLVIRDPSKPFGDNPPECLRQGAMIDYPMSTREQELRRVYALFDVVMKKLNLTYWPADGTLLGILRQGRVANDLDLDFDILTSLEGCQSVLQSVLNEFEKVANVYWTRIAQKDSGVHRGTAMFGMVRIHRFFGASNTGADFACVHRQSDNSLAIFNHTDRIMALPPNTLPLVPCRFYDLTVLCPGSGYALLAAFAPRYNGCIVFPHCFGDPETCSGRCPTPHRPVPLEAFVQATQTLERCNYGNLADHYRTHPYCPQLMLEKKHTGCCDPSSCTVIDGNKYCFLQKFPGRGIVNKK